MIKGAGNRELRRGIATAVIVALGLALPGCLWSSLKDFPMFLTATDDTVVFKWCGAPTGEYQYLEVLIQRDGAVSGVSGYGRFMLSTGQEFSTQSGPGEISFAPAPPISLRDGDYLFVGFGRSATDIDGATPQFDIKNPDELLAGKWISTNGEISDAPC